jgi:CheY-like chemotaxis protein
VLRVSDSGVGIAPDMLPRVFDVFVQEGQTLARSRGWLGLGLAIARSLIAQHGGSVSAESGGLGQGSTFVIRLPKAVAPAGVVAPPPQPTDREEPDLSIPRRVLVVDDNVDAAELLVDVLARFGCTAHAVHDGPAALAAVEAFRPDVALLDIGLPVMDGYELARRLAQQPGLADLRLVAVTGYGQRQDRDRSARAGFHAHLVKPLELTQLRQTLAQVMLHEANGRTGVES